MTRKGGARITGGGGSSNNPTPKCQQRQQLQPQNHPQPQEGIMSEYAIAAENQRDLEESYAELGLDQPRVIDRSSDQIKRDKNIIDAKMRGRQTRVEVSSGSADLPQRGSERHWFTTFLLLNRYLLISLFSVAGFICIATDSGVTQGYTDHSTSINKNVIIACLVLLFIIGGSVFSAMGGGEMWPESDNGDGDEENQATNQTTPPGGRKRCFSVFRCVPIPFSPIRTGLNSAQSAVRAGLNSAQSLFRPNSSNEPIRTEADLVAALKRYDNNLFKVLLGHKISDVSLLGELTEWRKKKILLSSGLDGTKDLIKVATGIHEFFIQAEAKSIDIKYFKILVLLHFPPDGQNLDETGVLYTGDEQIPINPTTEELVYLATIVLMGQFRIEADVLLEHGANELMSRIKKEVSSLPSSRNNLKRSWGSTTNSKFPKQEDLVARLSGETNQEKTISYYHLDIGVFYWEDCLKDDAPDGSLRDYGLPIGEKNTYKNITMGVQNNVVLGNWGAYVEANAPVQQLNQDDIDLWNATDGLGL